MSTFTAEELAAIAAWDKWFDSRPFKLTKSDIAEAAARDEYARKEKKRIDRYDVSRVSGDEN